MSFPYIPDIDDEDGRVRLTTVSDHDEATVSVTVFLSPANARWWAGQILAAAFRASRGRP